MQSTVQGRHPAGQNHTPIAEIGSRKTYARLIGALFLIGFLTYGIGFTLVNSVISVPAGPAEAHAAAAVAAS